MVESKKIQPTDIMREIRRIEREDMARYVGADGLLKPELAHPVDHCPCCGGSERSFLFHKNGFGYQQCSTCSLVYLEARLSDAELGYLYSEGRGMYSTKNFYIPTAEYRKETIYKRKLKEVENLVQGRRLLDYGSSAGYFLQLAMERGWSAHGLEVNPFCVNWARNELKLPNIHEGDLADCGFAPESFDAITLWDVLEHLTDPAQVLSAMRPLLAKDGVVVVESSHFDCFETRFMGPGNTNLTPDFHLMHFNAKSLDHLARRCGFRLAHHHSFGLDLGHIMRYQLLENGLDMAIPQDLVEALQRVIDESGLGCYIRAVFMPE